MPHSKTLMKHSHVIIYVIFFASGFCGLVYEVTWVRMLGLILGNSVYAVTLVLAAFMAGLGLGSLGGGRFIEKHENPLQIYGLIEIGIGGFALASPVILNLVNPVPAWAASNVTSSIFAVSIIRFALAFMALVIPTFLMGATFPVISRYFIRKGSQLGSGLGALYGINTMGAMAGCLAAGFALIETIGVKETIFVAALVNFAIGTAVILFGKSLDTESRSRDGADQIKTRVNVTERQSYSTLVTTIVLMAFGFSGFASIAYEVIWTRALGFFVGHTTYAFTCMLATFLFGIGAGSLLISGRTDHLKRLVVTLAFMEMLLGLLGMIGIPALSQAFFGMERWLGKRTWATPVGVKFGYTFAVMLLSTLLMGMTFPVAGKIYVSMKELGGRLGRLYAVNTMGGIGGSLIAGFALIPMMGVQHSIMVIAAVNMAAGGILLVVSGEIRMTAKASIILATLALAAVMLFALPWRKEPFSVMNRIRGGRSLYYSEGLTNTVEVIERESGTQDLYIDGELNASTSKTGMLVHRLLAEIPLVLHGDPGSMYLVGLGSGMTAAAALPFATIKTIGCAEISTDIVKALKYFREWNHDILVDNRFHLQIEDGRVALLTDSSKYDVMVTGIIHPKYNPGNASLYSQDYYELCRSHLPEGGIMCQWIPLNALRESEFKMIIRTFQAVFPHASMWFEELFGGDGNYNAVLIGSDGKLSISYNNLIERAGKAEGDISLQFPDTAAAYEYLDRFMLGENGLRAYAGSGPIITDDRPHLEFGTVVVSDFSKILAELGRKKESAFPYVTDLPELAQSGEGMKEEMQRRHDAVQACILGDAYRWQGDFQNVLAQYRRAVQIDRGNQTIQKELDRLVYQVNQIQGGTSDDARMSFNRGMTYQQAGRLDSAIALYNKALELRSDYLEARNNLGIAFMQQGLYDKAEAEFLRALAINPGYVQALANLGLIYGRTGRKELAIITLKKAQAIDPNDQVVKKFLLQIEKASPQKK